MNRRRKCSCGARVVWARDPAGNWVDVDPQGGLERPSGDLLVVLWGEVGAGDGTQQVTHLADFERQHGPYSGPVWTLHLQSCPHASRRIPWVVSARGRKLVAILEAAEKRKRGGAA